jgi:hypothetical protein
MEEERSEFLSRPSREAGTALVVVLMAIVILLPPTLVLATLAMRWQRQSIDLRDTASEELAAQAFFDEARARLAGDESDIAPGEARPFSPRPIEGIEAQARVSRSEDVVLSLDGRVLDGFAASKVDLDLTGRDAEGREVYQYRKLEVYLVEVEVSRRASLLSVRLTGILARLPDGSIETLGVVQKRAGD